LKKRPVDGFIVSVDEANILNWNILIFGPIDTHYEGGIFKAKLVFSTEYPFQPPGLIIFILLLVVLPILLFVFTLFFIYFNHLPYYYFF
jgi:hypothetical protein